MTLSDFVCRCLYYESKIHSSLFGYLQWYASFVIFQSKQNQTLSLTSHSVTNLSFCNSKPQSHMQMHISTTPLL
ncbi:hypothetical protein EYC80_005328 [Monilinia laxa]|uniref:Uncharacterized protein n=1 Tax=Monilinia laxa TaxID=61186 RepID=A0A5N6KJM1_MONLA|nr:hypothetical protein EYC80_005328 [Monilinia laxa]